jgi:hypothetical protein
MSLDIVTINQITTGTASPLPIAYSVCGMVGTGVTNPNEDGIHYIYTKLSDILTRHGDGSLYRGALLAFQNGCNKLHAVQTEISVESSDQDIATTSGTRDYAITGNADLASANIIAPGTLDVEYDPLGTPVSFTEGEDYLVDYSNSKIHLKENPATLATGLRITYDYFIPGTTSTGLQDALEVLDDKNINVICAPYAYKSAMVAKLKDQVVSAESAGYFRVGLATGQYLDATTIQTTANTNAYPRMAFCANRCGFQGNYPNLTDLASDTWMEFVDPTSAIMGLIAQRKPWQSIHNQIVTGTNWYGQFTTAELGDLETPASLFGKRIFVLNDPRFLSGSDIVVWQGWVTDSNVQFVDVQRTIDYVDFRIKAALSTSSVAGNLAVSRSGLEVIYTKIIGILKEIYRDGGINDPELLKTTHGYDAVDLEALNIFRKPAKDRTDDEEAYLQTAQNNREIDGIISFDYQGAIHTFALDLAIV